MSDGLHPPNNLFVLASALLLANSRHRGQSAFRFQWQFYRHKIFCRVKVILTRLVDDPEKAIRRPAVVGEKFINLRGCKSSLPLLFTQRANRAGNFPRLIFSPKEHPRQPVAFISKLSFKKLDPLHRRSHPAWFHAPPDGCRAGDELSRRRERFDDHVALYLTALSAAAMGFQSM